MNTSTTPHTPLETLLLFRGVAQHGLDDADFARISEALQRNGLVKAAPTYDARRLHPDNLRDLFLRLVREELRTESQDTPGPDGALSPASKKRRLQSPPLLTLSDARQHVEKIEAAHLKLHDAYLRHAVAEIRQFERQYEFLAREIEELEKSGVRDPETEPKLKPQSSNGAQEAAGKLEAGPANGVGPSAGASPTPSQTPTPRPVPNAARPLQPLQPLMPQAAAQQDARNGPVPKLQAGEKASAAPRSPAPTHSEAARSPQLSQQEVPKAPVARPATTPKPPNGPPQVLQAPQGVAPFQPPSQPPAGPSVAEGLQRPDGAAPRQSPAPPLSNVQVSAQGQLKWEPPYQPNAIPRQPANTNPQHHPPNVFPPPPHPIPSQRAPSQAPQQASPAPLQGQPSRPLPQQRQQVMVPPHSPSQFTPPLPSPPAKSPADLASAPGPSRQQPLHTNPAAGNVHPSQVPYHPQYPGYVPPGQATPGLPPLAAQSHPAQVHPGPARSPGVPPTTAPPTIPPRPSPGLAAPQQRPQPPNLQAPPYRQQAVPQAVPSSVPANPDAAQRYSSPYQPPRPAAVERIHPRQPATATPTPASRFSPAPLPPQTPTMTLPPRLAAGSGTKWASTSTPSTPKPGVERRLGFDDVPSPAFEPTSPVLRPSAAKEKPRREGPMETPKPKPNRPQVPQRAQGGVPAPLAPQLAAKQVSQPVEPDLARIKQEAATPRPSTETGDTTADESVTGRPQPARSTKRKREDLTPTPIAARLSSHLREENALPEGALTPSGGPKLVLWTRSFNKVCGSAMEQIVHHRSANMFAAPIREKDAPGYHKVVLQAQDLKTIRAAINHGNRAAQQAAAALPDGGDSGTSSVWLPRTEDLVPPRSIINSSQLDRELAHMFSNAIMYNPDPHHGPGPAFVKDTEEDDADGGDGEHHGGHHHQDSGVLGYKVDEFGVVNDARAMFAEVEKLLSELRSAEVRRNVPPGGTVGGGAVTGTSTRQASVLGMTGGAGGGESVKDDGGEDNNPDGEEEQGEGTVKRRRVGRG